MAKEAVKSDGLVCACGRPDLYEESLKQKEDGQMETVDSSTPNDADKDNSSVDSSDNGVQKP